MMVPRSYLQSSRTPMISTKRDEKATISAAVVERTPPKTSHKNGTAPRSIMPPNPLSPRPATASKPVVIPTKTRDGGKRRSRESNSKNGERKASQEDNNPHDPSSTPSSVAALLAMITLPDKNQGFRSLEGRRKGFGRTPENYHQAAPRRSISSSSPQSWGMLLSPPEEDEDESGSFESDATLGPMSSVRSMSTESMPSLDTDTESLGSASNPATPGLATSSRRQKSISTSIGEDCGLDHPLRPQTKNSTLDEEEEDRLPIILSSSPPAAAKASFSFKSNLTASFRKIRSAAQSISAFATPPNHREEALARSLFAPQYVDERRPEVSAELPDPVLRRYLNPVTFSPSEFHYHSDQESSQAMRPNCTASIQLQTYQRKFRPSNTATSPPIFTSSQQKAIDAVDGLPQASQPRQREPRENSDFLRVIVLEMNMRKVGKLNGDSPGRARLWLPARQAGKVVEEEHDKEKNRIPARWAGIRA